MFNTIKKYLPIACVAVYAAAGNVLAEDIQPIDCMIEPNIMVDISSPVDGVLDTLIVDRSDEVKEGEVVATLKSDVEQVAVKMSEERLKLSQVQYKRALGLYKKRAISLTERDKLENEKELAELDMQHAVANLDLRKIRSPIDGVVVKRYSSPGEFVESDPVIKIAQLDPLKIEVVSPVSNYGKIDVGMRAEIIPDFGGYQDLIAEVVVVDKVVDAASGTFGIRLELPNKDYAIPSGLKCKVRFMPGYVPEPKQVASLKEQVEDGISADNKVSPVQEVPAAESDDGLMCLTVGPFKEKEKLNDLLDAVDADIAKSTLRSDVKVKTTYLVTTDLIDTIDETKDMMRSMNEAGFTDIAIMNKSGRYRLALGLYRVKAFAQERVRSFNDKDYNVHMKPVKQDIHTYWADIAYLSSAENALLDIIPKSQQAKCDETVKLSLLK